MNKTERLNDMMLYLNDKNSINLKDITTKYAISKARRLEIYNCWKKLEYQAILNRVGRIL